MTESLIHPVCFISDALNWHELLKLFEYSDIYHTFDYVYLESLRINGTPKLVTVSMPTGLIGLVMIFRKIPGENKHFDATAVYGYNGVLNSPGLSSTDFNHGIERIKKALAQRGCVSFFNRESNFTTYRLPESTPRGKVLGVDLDQTPEVYEKSLPRRIRQQINALRKLNYTVIESSAPETIAEFCEVYRHTMLRRYANVSYFFSYNYFDSVLKIKTHSVSLRSVYHEGKMVCGAIFATEGKYMYYMFSGSLLDVTPYSVIRLIFDEIIRENLNRGKKLLHLGGGLGGAEDSLYQFKNSFGKIVLPFYTTQWILIPEVYNRLSAQSAPESNFFPRYRIA